MAFFFFSEMCDSEQSFRLAIGKMASFPLRARLAND
jgi:hypothetical protein